MVYKNIKIISIIINYIKNLYINIIIVILILINEK